MGRLELVVLAIVALAAGLYLALGLAIIVTALIERRLVNPLIPAEPDDSEWRRLGALATGRGSISEFEPEDNPYAAPGSSNYAKGQVVAISRLGFRAPRLLFKHLKGGIYQTYNVLTVSPSRQILVVIRWGTTASIRNEATLLYSALEDGRYLMTSDRLIGSRVPELNEDLVLLGADLEQLVNRHETRLLAAGKSTRLFSPEKPLAEYEAILKRRTEFLVERGDAYWVDPAETAFRSTLKGALKTYAQTFSTKHVDQSLRNAARTSTADGSQSSAL
jgi:hypothetical protein